MNYHYRSPASPLLVGGGSPRCAPGATPTSEAAAHVKDYTNGSAAWIGRCAAVSIHGGPEHVQLPICLGMTGGRVCIPRVCGMKNASICLFAHP